MLGPLHDHDHHDHDHDALGAEHASTLTIRIVSVFALLVSGLVGGLVPVLFARSRTIHSRHVRVCLAFSAGVILSLALVHILPESLHLTETLIPMDSGHHGAYPVGAVMVLLGVLLMYLVEQVLLSQHERKCIHTVINAGAEIPPEVEGGVDDNSKTLQSQSRPAAIPETDAKHRCWNEPPESATWKTQTNAYTVEFGCIYHSVLIGLGLGVTTNDVQQAVALTIALCFHQLLEGLGIGFILLRGFSLRKTVMMVIIYALTAPLGVCIGIGIAQSYEEESTISRAVQGTLNAVSAGMLLFLSIGQIMAETLSLRERGQSKTGWFVFAGLVLGSSTMCVLAIWA